jgi:hypothetical protein
MDASNVYTIQAFGGAFAPGDIVTIDGVAFRVIERKPQGLFYDTLVVIPEGEEWQDSTTHMITSSP